MQPQKEGLPRLVDAELDYLAASLPAGDPDYREVLLSSNNILTIEQAKGDKIRPWSGHGYTGHQTRHFGVAESENGLILRCSGPTARQHAADMVFHAAGLRASRVDLQSTTNAPQRHLNAQRELYKRICQLCESGHKLSKLHKRLWESPDGGATVTLGSPQSDRQFRHYNKSIEMGPGAPEGLERFELQLRDKLAKIALKEWSASANRPEYATKQVRGFMERYGIEEEWEQAPSAEWIAGGRKDTDLLLALSWLEKQVAPTVRRLIEAGKTAEVLEALKLSPEQLRSMGAYLSDTQSPTEP